MDVGSWEISMIRNCSLHANVTNEDYVVSVLSMVMSISIEPHATFLKNPCISVLLVILWPYLYGLKIAKKKSDKKVWT